jgi:hypothetical protein
MVKMILNKISKVNKTNYLKKVEVLSFLVKILNFCSLISAKMANLPAGLEILAREEENDNNDDDDAADRLIENIEPVNRNLESVRLSDDVLPIGEWVRVQTVMTFRNRLKRYVKEHGLNRTPRKRPGKLRKPRFTFVLNKRLSQLLGLSVDNFPEEEDLDGLFVHLNEERYETGSYIKTLRRRDHLTTVA